MLGWNRLSWTSFSLASPSDTAPPVQLAACPDHGHPKDDQQDAFDLGHVTDDEFKEPSQGLPPGSPGMAPSPPEPF